MSRRSTESPDNSFNRLSSPPNQWQTRSVSPINQFNQTTENLSNRQLGPINPIFGSNFGNQRFFTPRSSYFSQQNDNSVLNSVQNMNQNFNQNYDFNRMPRPQPSYDTNRPIYSTDILNSLDSEDINQLRNAIMNVNQMPNQLKAEKSDSSENSVNNMSDSKPNRMEVLIEEMKKLTDREDTIKKNRRNIERKISDLDEELKEYEKKFSLRENLKKLKSELDNQEECLAIERNNKLMEMEQVNKSIDNNNTQSIDSNGTEIVSKNVEITLKPEIQSNMASVPKPTLKRVVPSTDKTLSNKRVRISETATDSSGASTPVHFSPKPKIITTPKVSTKPVTTKGTPIPSKPILKNNLNTEVESLKVNQLCRQQTSNLTPITSGIKTSRPQKMMSSRNKRIASQSSLIPSESATMEETVTSEQTSMETESLPITVSQNVSQTKSVKESIGSDNDVFKELEKISSEINSNSIESNKNCDTNQNSITKEIQNNDKFEENMNTDTIDDNVFRENNENTESENNHKNNEELIEINSDEDVDTTQQPLGQTEVKAEKPDSDESSTNDSLNTKEQMSYLPENLKHLMNPSLSSESSDPSEDQNSLKESPFKVPNELTVSKKKLKYRSIEPIRYEPTGTYLIGSFKAIAGPKSKTSKTSVIFLKSFRDYLIVSFLDQSVRRFHIEDKTNILKYEGHQNIVLDLLVIQSSKQSDIFILYTGGKDKILRAFDVMSGQFLNSIDLNDEINCIVFNWSHIFCALNNGSVCKVEPIHESEEQITDNTNKISSFVVNSKKKLMTIIAVDALDPISENSNPKIEAIIAISSNKLRIINTIDGIPDDQRILESIPGSFSIGPTFVRTFKNILIITYKCPPIKNEAKELKLDNKSCILMYNMNSLSKDSKPLKQIIVNDIITAMDLVGQDLIFSCFSKDNFGKIQCIDCEKVDELKWTTYGSKVTALVKIKDRLVFGNPDGIIDVIYLDQTFVECETCGVTFARQIDNKQHIKLDHNPSESSDEEQSK